MSWLRGLIAVSCGACFVLFPAVAEADRVDPVEHRPVVAPQPNLERDALLTARPLFRSGDFARGIERLQGRVLDRPGDRMVSLMDGGELRTVGARAEASRLLFTLPETGRQLYEAKYGPAARKLLANRKTADDAAVLRRVVRQYPVTIAGIEAAFLLGTRELLAGRSLSAAMLLDPLRSFPAAAKVHEPRLSLHAAVAFARGGLPEKAVRVLNDLRRSQGAVAVRVSDKPHAWFQRERDALPWLAGVLRSEAGFAEIDKELWAGRKTDLTPSAADARGVFAGKPVWNATVIATASMEFSKAKNKRMQELHANTVTISQRRRTSGGVSIPAARPAVIGSNVINRCLYSFRANALRNGDREWWLLTIDEAVRRGIPFNSKPGKKTDETRFLTQKVWSDRTAADWSATHNLLAITDANSALELARLQDTWRYRARTAAERVKGWDEFNVLSGFDIRSGKILWRNGGEKSKPSLPLAGSFFLGPPLPSRGLLFALTESDRAVRLQAIQPRTGRPVWSATLYSPRDPISLAPVRRLAGCRPFSAGGVFVCRTADERVIAFDLLLRQPLWEYRYRGRYSGIFDSPLWLDQAEKRLRRIIEEDSGDRWVDNEPHYLAGRVVLAPRDSDELHCVDAISGRLLWKSPRGGGLYVAAVAGGNVIVVGKSGVRALRLADGQLGWRQSIATLAPSGIGIRAGRFYRLPLSSGEIATIDLAGGRILARIPTPKDHIPGNLAAGGDVLVSQNPTTVAAFASGTALQSQIDKQLKTNANDPAALLLRGEVRLQQGDVTAAIADLRRAIKLRPALPAKRLLATALNAELQRDAAANRTMLPEAEALAKETGEWFEFVRSASAGLDAAGESAGAFRICMKYSNGKDSAGVLVPAGASRWVARTTWVRGRLESLYRDARPPQRRVLDAAVARRLDAAMKTGSAQSLRTFLQLFRWHPIATRARIALVEAVRRSGRQKQ